MVKWSSRRRSRCLGRTTKWMNENKYTKWIYLVCVFIFCDRKSECFLPKVCSFTTFFLRSQNDRGCWWWMCFIRRPRRRRPRPSATTSCEYEEKCNLWNGITASNPSVIAFLYYTTLAHSLHLQFNTQSPNITLNRRRVLCGPFSIHGGMCRKDSWDCI